MQQNNLTTIYSNQSFLNSLLRDFSGDDRFTFKNNKLIIAFSADEKLIINADFISITGNHKFSSEYILEENGNLTHITPGSLKEIIITKLFPHGDNSSFLSNILESDKELERIFDAQKTTKQASDNYIASEQNLLFGHPFHPFPKLKKGMTNKETEKFSPEYASKFKLQWILLDNDIVESLIASAKYKDAIVELAKFEGITDIPTGKTPFPFHPWQLRKLTNIAKEIKTSEGLNDWYPTSSMRSLYCNQAPFTIKFSMSVQLTNSVRVLTKNECMRGLQVTQLKETSYIQEHLKKYDNFKILGEPVYSCIKGVQESSFVLRDNFENESADYHLLATFIEKKSDSKISQLGTLVKSYSSNKILATKLISNSFFKKIIEPILTLATDHGVLLGAHLQNIIISTKDGLFDRVLFKDCQGSGFTQHGSKKFEHQIANFEKENGNILDSENVNKIFSYYLIINTTFSFISEMADGDSYLEKFIINEFKNFLFTLSMRDQIADRSIISNLLNSETLWQKGNFRCSVESHNENTMADPTLIYNKIPNPIFHNARTITPNTVDKIVYTKEVKKLSRPISFRVMNNKSDLETFYTWQHQGYVKEFWEMNLPKEELKTYIHNLIKSPYQTPLMCLVDEKPIGYFEVYNAYGDRIAPYCNPESEDMGFHFLIGEEKFLGSRYVIESINCICDYLFQSNLNTKRIWGEPRADNKKVIKFATSLPGWSLVKEFDFPHKRAALTRCDRSRFFQEYLSGK
ncbi:GNAT family N-acetyltransferase [Bacteriovorax sp. Seq25_V]|uniref:GNAT family N-acetyltransferase n=1 Tax=Bacteriovorax sp. Seq25_V TaxID=1201288 RepID=UPI000389FD54|nr:GNAT family N-acetyltransferase [Bacteriovorax sp. Seq25_V]EQC47308.1 siderophore biosynthesis protein, IucA/IucC family [Bacteriovorax sp. Seq25_V]